MLAQQKTGRDHDGAGFQRTQYRDHRMEIGAEPQHDPVAARYTEATQDIRESIRQFAQLGIRIWTVIEPRRNFGAAACVDVPIDVGAPKPPESITIEPEKVDVAAGESVPLINGRPKPLRPNFLDIAAIGWVAATTPYFAVTTETPRHRVGYWPLFGNCSGRKQQWKNQKARA